MSNPVEIVARYLREAFCVTAGFDEAALAIIAALEKEGYKVVVRDEAISYVSRTAPNIWRISDDDDFVHVFHDLFDVAPRYGEPSK